MKKVIIAFYVVIVIYLIAITFYVFLKPDKCESCKLYEPTAQHGINGLYVTDEYFCVWTKDRSKEIIENTTIHEECHALVWDNYDHFCRNGLGKNETFK